MAIRQFPLVNDPATLPLREMKLFEVIIIKKANVNALRNYLTRKREKGFAFSALTLKDKHILIVRVE